MFQQNGIIKCKISTGVVLHHKSTKTGVKIKILCQMFFSRMSINCPQMEPELSKDFIVVYHYHKL